MTIKLSGLLVVSLRLRWAKLNSKLKSNRMKILLIAIMSFVNLMASCQTKSTSLTLQKQNMEELKVLRANALEAYSKADSGGKSLLVNLFGKKHFLTDARDRIKTFDDACQDQGVIWNDADYKGWSPDEIAYRKMKIIVKALNGDWVADWNNSSQAKWYPWFVWTGSGFRFHDTYCVYALASAGSGSRLRLCSKEMATYFGTQFIDIINESLK